MNFFLKVFIRDSIVNYGVALENELGQDLFKKTYSEKD
jgi:hypothetical protein